MLAQCRILEFPNKAQRVRRSADNLMDDGRRKPVASDPIVDKELLNEIKQHILSTGKYGHRNYLIFLFGINTGRRCGDILKLRVRDVAGRTSVTHIEEKTRKTIQFGLNATLQEAIAEYLAATNLQLDDYLFPSRKRGYHLSTKSYWRILQQVQEDLDLNLHLGTHAMRKTFGYHHYRAGMANAADRILLLQKAFGHSSAEQTMTYIGLTDEHLQEMYDELEL